MRCLFYGHVIGLGLGHFSRSARLAEAATALGASCTVTGGDESAGRLVRCGHVSHLPLPAATVSNLSAGIVVQRERRLLEFLRSDRPDAVIVDLLPFGLGGELVAALLAARQESWPTRFFWGLPYSETRVPALRNPRLRAAMGQYAGVLVYEEPDWMDPVPDYRALELPGTIDHVGMVTCPVESGIPRVVLGVIGSGGLAGGPALLEAFLEAAAPLARRAGLGMRFVTGPLADLEAMRGIARGHPDLELVARCSVEEAARDAAVVVSRVGYNSAYTLARSDLPLVLVPSTWPEQLRRAALLAKLDGIWSCSEDDLTDRLPHLLEQALSRGRAPRDLPFRVDGADRAARRLADLVGDARSGSDPVR
ncbi:MAG: hypothetical protein HY815_17710 [Candidatus Riflebacteria bacterium]|nr:hypothetical protein [Candidatus Riflebacteria bacterium]